MFIFDRLYGHLKFPSLIMKLLDCPGLQRLRDIRMANIPFLSFPSFSNTSRFEHSLGVCYLAQMLSKRLDLTEKNEIELMIAALYHDVATPPFAHAVEEVMDRLFGFDHEKKLNELITGDVKIFSGQKHQIFLGRTLKLHRICQSSQGQKLGLDLYRIADLALGVKNDLLGDLICSDGIDLDNIDNVVRAATSMGINVQTSNLSEKIALSFCYYNKQIHLHEDSKPLIYEWQDVRSKLYNLIFASIQDFAQQTMLKEAINLLANNSGFLEDDWALTDSQLLSDRLREYEPTKRILHRLQLGNPYNCVAVFIVEGTNSIKRTKDSLSQIELIAKEDFVKYLSGTVKSKPRSWDDIKILANFYIDKRYRPINRKYYFMGRLSSHEENIITPRVILGLFSAYDRRFPLKQIDILAENLQNNCYLDCKIHPATIVMRNQYPTIQ